MFEPLDITRMAQSLASYAGSRLGLVAHNIAQADTPGFKAMDLPDFAEVYGAQDGQGAMRATRPQHLGWAMQAPQPVPTPTRGEASANGNTVSLEKEMVKMADVRTAHDMALSIYRVTQDITRAALGRR